MAKTKIKKDRHGLYLKTDGSIFRPVQTNDARLRGLSPSGGPSPEGVFAASAETTQFREFDAVSAIHRAGTELAIVRSGGGSVNEYWYSHGCYIGDDLKQIKSEDVWRPVTKRPETEIIMNDMAVMVSRDIQRRLFRHMVALRIKELDTAATLAKSLTVELSGQFLEKADALASTTPDAYAISDEVIDSYLKQLRESA